MTFDTRLLGEGSTVLKHTEFRILLFINFILPLGVVPLGPALSNLTQPLGVTESTIGLVITAFILPSIVMTPFIGIIIDRLGRKPIFTVCLVIFGICGVLIAFVDEFVVIIVLRVFQGIGFAGASPLVIICIGDLYQPPIETTAQGLTFTTVGIAEAIFPAVVGFIVTIAWQLPFLLYGLALLAAAIVYIWFPEFTDEETSQSTILSGGTSTVSRLLFVARQRRAMAYVLALSASSFIHTGFITYVSFLIVDKGGSATITGAVVAISSVAIAVASTQAGRVATFFGNRTYPLALAALVQATGILAIVLSPALIYVYLPAALLGAGNGLVFPLSRSIITDIPTTGIRGSFVSLAESFGRIGVAVGPVLMGGFISATRSKLGTSDAVQWSVALVTVVFTILMIAFLAIALYSPPIESKNDSNRREVQ